LLLITGDDILDSFEAIAAAMYTDGIVEPKTKLKPKADDDVGNSESKLQEDDDEDDSDLSKTEPSSSLDGCLLSV
jgi:hypothetical protein